jgi:hypothetical protein
MLDGRVYNKLLLVWPAPIRPFTRPLERAQVGRAPGCGLGPVDGRILRTGRRVGVTGGADHKQGQPLQPAK